MGKSKVDIVLIIECNCIQIGVHYAKNSLCNKIKNQARLFSLDRRETDFLILKNGQPWCLFKAKLSDAPVGNHHRKHAEALGGIPVVQLTQETKVVKKSEGAIYRISASRFFS